jgi:hypothetical protein
MPQNRNFPYQDRDVTVLGPEIFASNDGQVICWKGHNYVRQPDQGTVKVQVCMGPVDVDEDVKSAIIRQLRRARRNPPSGGA